MGCAAWRPTACPSNVGPRRRQSSRSLSAPRRGDGRSCRFRRSREFGSAQSCSLLTECLERSKNRPVAGAPADVAGQRLSNLEFRRMRVRLQEVGTGDDDTGSAETALNRSRCKHRFLHGVQITVRGQALDGCHVGTLGIGSHDEARTDRFTIEDHGARTALSLFTCILRARQVEIVSQDVQQTLESCNIADALFAVDGDRHIHRRLRSTSRRARRPAAYLRYASVDRWSVIGRTSSATTRATSSRVASVNVDSALSISSARVARIGVVATDPRAIRKPSPPRMTRQLTVAITIAFRTPTFANSCATGTPSGTTTAVIISSGSSDVRFTPMKNSRHGTTLVPLAWDRTSMKASAAAIHGRPSPAGLAVPTFPPIVPAARIWGDPTVRAASARPLGPSGRPRSAQRARSA